MIDWDEIDWKQGIATLVLGIGLIAGGIFVLDDYFRSIRTQEALTSNLDDLNSYAAKYQPPALTDSSQLEAEAQGLEARLAQAQVKLPESYDDAAIQADFETRARELGVNLIRVEAQPAISRGYVVIHPFQVSFSGTQGQITDFLGSLNRIPYLHEMKGGNISLSDQIRVTVNLVSFDQASWLDANPCQELTPPPQLRETKAESLYLFKGNLLSMQQEVARKFEDLKKAQTNTQKICDLKHRLGIARDKLQALSAYSE